MRRPSMLTAPASSELAARLPMRQRLSVLLWLIAALTALFAPAWLGNAPRLVYNLTDSAPRGFYLVQPAEVQPGDWVLASLPAAARHLAAQRQYLPAGIPVLKQVGAVGGEHVCVRDSKLWVNAHELASVLTQDSQGRALDAWLGCRRLQPREVFLLSLAHPSSYDSRYFGPVDLPAVHGRVRPVWTWSAP